MLRTNKLKPFISHTDEQDKINKLRITRELLERENVEITKVLNDKRKNSGLDYKACQRIEDEHFSKVDEADNKYLVLIEQLNEKNKELEASKQQYNNIIESEAYLKGVIPSLKKAKAKLEEEIKETAEKFNQDKENSEIYLSNIRERIDKRHKEFKELSDELSQARKEFNQLIEDTQLENKVLSTRKRDMEIYEARFRAKNPDKTIILQ